MEQVKLLCMFNNMFVQAYRKNEDDIETRVFLYNNKIYLSKYIKKYGEKIISIEIKIKSSNCEFCEFRDGEIQINEENYANLTILFVGNIVNIEYEIQIGCGGLDLYEWEKN